MNNCGVYAIINKINGHRYIGSSAHILHRWQGHEKMLNDDKHHNRHLQSAWKKYGGENFQFILLAQCDPPNLVDLEQDWIDIFHPEYNICPKAGSCRGRIVTAEHRRKNGLAKKGIPLSEEHKRKLSGATKGRPLTEEHRRRVAIANKNEPKFKNHKHTEESRIKISMSETGRKGHPNSDETRRKISEANRNRIISEETREKQREAGRRRRHTPEELIKMSISIKEAKRKKKEAQNE
jgi:group I intron endonuclease